MFNKFAFQTPSETFEHTSCVGSLMQQVKKIAQKESRNSLYDLGFYVAENNIITYTVDTTTVAFRVAELYGDKVLHAKNIEDESWTYITKFDCN